MQDREDDARALFERLLGLRNDVGLLSEEYDPVAKRMTGNFPQAFSHTALIASAMNLACKGRHRRGRLEPRRAPERGRAARPGEARLPMVGGPCQGPPPMTLITASRANPYTGSPLDRASHLRTDDGVDRGDAGRPGDPVRAGVARAKPVRPGAERARSAVFLPGVGVAGAIPGPFWATRMGWPTSPSI